MFNKSPDIPHAKPCAHCGTPLTNANAHCHNPACDWCTPCADRKRREVDGR